MTDCCFNDISMLLGTGMLHHMRWLRQHKATLSQESTETTVREARTLKPLTLSYSFFCAFVLGQ